MVMPAVKQAIIVRKDLKMRKSKLAAVVARASAKFIVENNEAERKDELHVKLSNDEVDWIKSSFPIVLAIDSQAELEKIILQAELSGINVYSIFSTEDPKAEERAILCSALGPDDEEVIDQITKNLKLF